MSMLTGRDDILTSQDCLSMYTATQIITRITFSHSETSALYKLTLQHILYERLCLVCSRRSSTTSSLKLPSLRSDIRSAVGSRHSRSWAEVLDGFSCFPCSLNENCIFASWCSLDELIEGDTLSTSSENSGSCSPSESKSTNSHLGDIKFSNVVGNSSHDDSNLAFSSITCHIPLESSEGYGRSVDIGRTQPLEDDGIKFLTIILGCSSGKVSVSLNEEKEVRILGYWSLPSCLSIVFMVDVDSLDAQ